MNIRSDSTRRLCRNDGSTRTMAGLPLIRFAPPLALALLLAVLHVGILPQSAEAQQTPPSTDGNERHCSVVDRNCVYDASIRQGQAFVLTNGPGHVLRDDNGRPFTELPAAANHLFSKIPAPPDVADGYGAIAFAAPFDEFNFSGEAQLSFWHDWFIFTLPGEQHQIRWLRLGHRDRDLSPLDLIELVPTEGDGEWVLALMTPRAPDVTITYQLPDLSALATPLPVPMRIVDFEAHSNRTAPGAGTYNHLRIDARNRGGVPLHGTIRLTKTPGDVLVATIEALAWRGGSVDRTPTLVPFAATFRVRTNDALQH